ncbi:MAG TPA: hypothetical protein VMU94_31870 [Streptosporangiaceae bacterium]|nr:hypothetical protein [Streptosporangiaceae bacterium]
MRGGRVGAAAAAGPAAADVPLDQGAGQGEAEAGELGGAGTRDQCPAHVRLSALLVPVTGPSAWRYGYSTAWRRKELIGTILDKVREVRRLLRKVGSAIGS